MKDLRARLRNRETVLGCFLNLGSPLTAEVVGLAGFDWVLIDLEHGAGREGDLLGQLQALEHTPAAPVVRVESHERQRAHRVLDLGACGVMFPRVNTAAEAATVVAAMRYPREGVRGVAQMIRATQFGADFAEYQRQAAERLVCIAQIETPEAVENVEAIAAVEGVDVLFIGPSDLSMSMGIFGQLDHPDFLAALRRTAEAAARHGRTAGVLLREPGEMGKYRALGYRFLACGSDGGLLARAARNLAQALRNRAAQA